VKKLILLLVVIVSFTTHVVASNNDPGNIKLLSGKIIDKQTGEALQGVKVQVKGTDKYCYTDSNGCFVLTISSPAAAEVSIDMVGYEPMTLKTQELSTNPDLVLNPR